MEENTKSLFSKVATIPGNGTGLGNTLAVNLQHRRLAKWRLAASLELIQRLDSHILKGNISKDEGETGHLGSPEREVEVVMFNHRHLDLVTFCRVRETMLRSH